MYFMVNSIVFIAAKLYNRYMHFITNNLLRRICLLPAAPLGVLLEGSKIQHTMATGCF